MRSEGDILDITLQLYSPL